MIGRGLDERFTRTTINGSTQTTLSYLVDTLGSTVGLANGGTAQNVNPVQTIYGYDPFGNPATPIGTPDNGAYRFTGRELDGTGLQYNRNRYYYPGWGRFISEDPIGFAGGINQYAYVGGNPSNRNDPSGLLWIYAQATGEIVHVNDSTDNVDYRSKGYAGNGDEMNDPQSQDVHDHGPLPQGNYGIGPEMDQITHSKRLLKSAMRLTPEQGNEMFGRRGFLIHGKGLSNGCIATDQATRDKIGGSGDTNLSVTP